MAKKEMLRKRIVVTALCLSLAVFFCPVFTAVGAEYPERPIKLIIPYSPGGVSDLTWRSLTDRMGEILGQPIVLLNKPGGGATLGYSTLAKSKPDGYTIGHISLGSFVNNYLMYNVPYDPLKNFDYVCGIAQLAGSIIVKTDAPWKTWDEFVDYSKKHPNELRMGFSGTGGVVTVATKWAAKELGLTWRQVTFPGEAEGILALLGGNVDAFPGPGAHNRLINDGRARPLLSVTNDPIPAYPQVPTFKQLYGKDANNANGLMVPKGIPEPIRKKLEDAVHEASKGVSHAEMMKKMNMMPNFRTAEEFTQDVKNAISSFKVYLDALGMRKKK